MLRVFYPQGGEHYLLKYWTHQEQNHIVVARTPEAVLRTASLPGFGMSRIPEIKTFEHIHIVQPSPEFQYICRRRQEAQERLDFQREATYMAREYLEQTGTDPNGFGPCRHYVSQGGSTEEEDPDHYNCRGCCSKVVGGRAVVRDLYTRAERETPPGEGNWRYHWNKAQRPSKAPFAISPLPMVAMVGSLGPHCSGVLEQPVPPSVHAAWWANWNNVLFYYHVLGPLPEWKARAEKVMAEREAVFNKSRESSNGRRQSEEERRKALRLLELKAFFDIKG